MSLENRIRALEESTPQGYRTFDAEGRPVIESDLPAGDWWAWAFDLFSSRGREAEKKRLRELLARSEGPDNGGGLLYEMIEALFTGQVEGERNADHNTR